MSVAGIGLGDRESARAFLADYSPGMLEDGRPAYYFYNKYGTQVMKVTAASFEDRFFVTEIEVFSVGRSYKKGHYHAEKIGWFITESKIFIGYKQSVRSMLIGIPNVSRGDMIGPKDVVKKKGEPTGREKTGERETVTYDLPDVEIKDETTENKTKRFSYFARYEFNKNKLKKFTLKISPRSESEEKASD
jgi:hypothetical protein